MPILSIEAISGARRSRCPYLRNSARFLIALRSTRRTPTPSRYTSRAHSHNGARRRPRDSTSRVRVPASSACGNGSPRSFGSCGTRPRSCPRRARGRCRREQTGAISPVGLPALLLSSPHPVWRSREHQKTAVDLRVVLTGPGHGGVAAPELPKVDAVLRVRQIPTAFPVYFVVPARLCVPVHVIARHDFPVLSGDNEIMSKAHRMLLQVILAQ